MMSPNRHITSAIAHHLHLRVRHAIGLRHESRLAVECAALWPRAHLVDKELDRSPQTTLTFGVAKLLHIAIPTFDALPRGPLGLEFALRGGGHNARVSKGVEPAQDMTE